MSDEHTEEAIVTRPAGPRKRTPEQEDRLASLARMSDDQIDTSDIPEITDQEWENSILASEFYKLYKPRKVFTSFRCDADVLAWLKSQGPGYGPRMNQILRKAMRESMG